MAFKNTSLILAWEGIKSISRVKIRGLQPKDRYIFFIKSVGEIS